MKPRLFSLSLAFASLCMAPPLQAQLPDNPHVPAAFSLPESEVWDMQASHGETYRIFVSRPAGEAPAGGYPVLYILDGNALFGGFASSRWLQGAVGDELGKLILVGIGYPGDEAYSSRRMGDFTAPLKSPELKKLYSGQPSGKRDAFQSFLLNELRPEIARRYQVAPERQSLFGHSLGGLFALHMLYEFPGAYHAIIAASPSIWWDGQAILEEERQFTRRLKNEPNDGDISRLLLMVGGREETPVLIDDCLAFAERIKPLSAYGLRSSLLFFEEETHISVPTRAINDTLRKAVEWP